MAVSKTYTGLLKVGEPVNLTSLDGDSSYKGVVSRINGSVDLTTQTITAFIEVSHPDLREGMYLEAEIDARQETSAIEINRNLVFDENKIFIVRDSVLDIITVNPVYFSDKRAVLKDVQDGTYNGGKTGSWSLCRNACKACF